MTCREAVEFLMAYLDGELPAAQRAEFERHLTGCHACVDYVESYKRTVALGKAAGGAAPEHVPEELVRAILGAKDAKRG